MRFFTTAVVLLSLVASGLAAPPAEGIYAIVNRVLSPKGEELAITFNGEGQAATLTPRSDCGSQRWKLQNCGDETMSVTPVSADNLQAACGKDYVTVLPAHDYVWAIDDCGTGYTIQDAGKTVFWGAACADAGQNVTIGVGDDNEKQRWILHKF